MRQHLFRSGMAPEPRHLAEKGLRMPLSINVKRRDPRFKGDQPRFLAVVSGPSETFRPELCRLLELQGLAPIKDDDGFAIWSQMPSPGPAPRYLVHLLKHKYGARAHRDCAEDAALPVNARPGPIARSIDALAPRGPTGRPSAGRRALRVQATRSDFVVNCDADDPERAAFIEAAGWIPVENVTDQLAERLGTQPWRTRDPFVAGHLEPFFNENAKELLKRQLADARRNIAASRRGTSGDGPDIPCPDGESFLPFQENGIHVAMGSPGGTLIADDMGLGKTLQGIGVVNASPEARNVLIVCQASMRVKWVQEIEKWRTNHDLDVGLAEGSHFPDTPIVVINYDILQRNEAALRAREWDIIICDEAHSLKNPEAQRTRALLGEDGAGMLPMAKNGRLLHLTGTPRPNRPEELWPLLSSTRPDLWGRGPEALRVFRNRYAPPSLIKTQVPSTEGGATTERVVPVQGKPVRESELQLRLRGSGSFVRRLKRDMGDQLPPKFRARLDIPVRLTREERESLREAEFELDSILTRTGLVDVAVGESQRAGAVIDQITRMNPDRPDFREMSRVRRNLGCLKAPHCARFLLDEIEEDADLDPEERTKTVVFAHHKDVVQAIHAEAHGRMPGTCLVYDGRVTAKQRQEFVDRFQTDDEIRCMIITLSGATGITLTAAARMRVVEPDWTPSNMLQIEDRIWRIGQKRNVEIGYLCMAGTLDARIGEALVSKMQSDEKTLNRIRFEHDRSASAAESAPAPGP